MCLLCFAYGLLLTLFLDVAIIGGMYEDVSAIAKGMQSSALDLSVLTVL